MAPPSFETIAREEELARLRDFIDGATTDRGLVFVGPPGVGKTTLWEAGVALAKATPAAVLVGRAAEAECALPFAGLSDLLAGVDLAALELPIPQRRALDVALQRVDVSGLAPERHAVSLGLVHVLQALARERTVMVAIDDLQWLDLATADALAFSLRRLTSQPVVLLASRRPGPSGAVERAVGADRIREVSVDGMSLGATRRLLLSRLRLSVPRRVARQVFEATLGNPLYVLEIGRTFLANGPPAIGEDLAVPASLDDVLGRHVADSPLGEAALLPVALGGPLPRTTLAELAGDEAIEAALQSGLLVEVSDRLSAAHPLLANAAIRRTRTTERRAVHAALAESADDPVRRARHLAATATGPDAELARVVALGAREAMLRGAIKDAIELSHEALRLTPLDDASRDERVIDLGELLHRAMELEALALLIGRELDSLRPGTPRARGYLLSADVTKSQERYEAALTAALAEPADGETHGRAFAELSLDAAVAHLERLDAAEEMASHAIALIGQGPGLRRARYARAWIRVLRGREIDDVDGPTPAATANFAAMEYDPRQMAAIRNEFRGELAPARSLLASLAEEGAELGDEEAWASFQHVRCEVEIRAGDVHAAQALLHELETVDDTVRIGIQAHQPRLRATLACLRGEVTETRRLAEDARAVVLGQRWDLLEIDRILGLAALLDGDPARAVDRFLAVWRHCEREGVDEVGVFPVAAELVEASLAVGRRDLAGEVMDRLARLSVEQDHPWGKASLRRCRGIALLTDGAGWDDAVAADVSRAADEYAALGCHFDSARTLLALGREARRARKWGVARDALSRSATILGGLGCEGWAAQARLLVGGLSGRRPSNGSLTATEGRVAELASRGHSNKEIAAALFVSEHTVEVHLGHAYPKLGIRSRSELARALDGLKSGSLPTKV
jgi:DNA-binding CsgD family transcriptional regulator